MEVLEQVQAVLCSKGIISSNEDEGLRTPVHIGVLGGSMRIHVQNGLLKCIIFIPVFTPIYRRSEVAQAIARANFRLNSGRFELDMEDGELRFYNALPIFDTNPTEEQLGYLLFWSWKTADRYSTALLEVATTEVPADVAIARAEASWKEEQREAAALPN